MVCWVGREACVRYDEIARGFVGDHVNSPFEIETFLKFLWQSSSTAKYLMLFTLFGDILSSSGIFSFAKTMLFCLHS